MIWNKASFEWRSYRAQTRKVHGAVGTRPAAWTADVHCDRCKYHVCSCPVPVENVAWLKIADVLSLPNGERVRVEAEDPSNTKNTIGTVLTKEGPRLVTLARDEQLPLLYADDTWRFSLVEAEKKLLTVDDVRELCGDAMVRIEVVAPGNANTEVGSLRSAWHVSRFFSKPEWRFSLVEPK
jgi:hypothetical protein